MIKNSYFSNGKLLLSGEFLVLEGATALALPLKYGQHLKISPGDNPNLLQWESKYKSSQWFDASYDIREMELLKSSDPERGKFIQKLLINALRNNPKFIRKLEGKNVEALLDFDPDWGWGSSSTLISNIAYWSETNPFDLFFNTQEGSAYDIACARASTPILYQMGSNSPSIQEVSLKKALLPHLFFIYLGRKQNTAEGIRAYRQTRVFDKLDIQSISEITMDMIRTSDIRDFNMLIREHERIIAKVIRKKPVQDEYFSDFEGAVKSLGTWGGDFIMMTYEGDKTALVKYLQGKKLDKVFSYSEIAL